MLRDNAYSWRPIADTDHRGQHRLAELGHVGDGFDAVRPQLVGRHRADAPQPPHRQRVQECQLAAGRNQQQAIRFGFLAGHLGEKFRPGDADGDRQPDPRPDVAAQPGGNLDRGSGDPPQPADIDESLVHRQGLHQRRGISEDLEHRVAGLRIGRHPWRNHHGLRAQPPRLGPTHCGAHAVGLGLVAGRQNDTAADDYRPSPEPRVVALLDGGIERVEVRMQDGRLGRHEHMFAPGCD